MLVGLGTMAKGKLQTLRGSWGLNREKWFAFNLLPSAPTIQQMVDPPPPSSLCSQPAKGFRKATTRAVCSVRAE